MGLVERVVLAIPRFLYRRVTGEAQGREAQRQDLRAIRDALIEAQNIGTIQTSTTPKWNATRQACVRGVGLASAGPDETLRDLVRSYRDAHDAVAGNWYHVRPDQWSAMQDIFDRAMERIAILDKR